MLKKLVFSEATSLWLQVVGQFLHASILGLLTCLFTAWCESVFVLCVYVFVLLSYFKNQNATRWAHKPPGPVGLYNPTYLGPLIGKIAFAGSLRCSPGTRASTAAGWTKSRLRLQKAIYIGGGFKHVLFSSLVCGRWIHFVKYFLDGVETTD